MKLKLDENLPESLVSELTALGHDVDNVRIEGLAGRNDPSVWHAAQQTARFFVTQDLDFSDVRQFAPGAHYGLMLVRLRVARKASTRRPYRRSVPNGKPGDMGKVFYYPH